MNCIGRKECDAELDKLLKMASEKAHVPYKTVDAELHKFVDGMCP